MIDDSNFSSQTGKVIKENGQVMNWADYIYNYVGYQGSIISDSFTRPNNTTQYAAYDVVSDSLTTPSNLVFETGFRPGSCCIIRCARIVINDPNVPEGMDDMLIALFNEPPTPIADNSPFTLLEEDKSKFVDYIRINEPMQLGGVLFGTVKNVNSCIKLVTSKIYGQLITVGGARPVANAVLKTCLSFEGKV